MRQIIITRKQYEKLKEVFEMYDLDRVIWKEESLSGIGPNVTLEFNPSNTVKVDITDIESW
ncbi:MAG: hypothetical protein ACO3UU_07225 [Minisyncoccia bacterium]